MVVCNTALEAASVPVSVTVAPAMPTSPASRTPSLSRSTKTDFDRPEGLAEVLSVESVERYDDGIDGVGRGACEAGRLRLDEHVAAGREVLEAVAAVGVGRQQPDRRAERRAV